MWKLRPTREALKSKAQLGVWRKAWLAWIRCDHGTLGGESIFPPFHDRASADLSLLIIRYFSIFQAWSGTRKIYLLSLFWANPHSWGEWEKVELDSRSTQRASQSPSRWTEELLMVLWECPWAQDLVRNFQQLFQLCHWNHVLSVGSSSINRNNKTILVLRCSQVCSQAQRR